MHAVELLRNTVSHLLCTLQEEAMLYVVNGTHGNARAAWEAQAAFAGCGVALGGGGGGGGVSA